MSRPAISKSDFVTFVLNASIHPLNLWEQPEDPPDLGPEYRRQLEILKEERDHLIKTITDTLNARDVDWFQGKYGPSGRALNEEAAEEQEIWRREARRMTDKLMPWFEAGLGLPDYVPDFDYWSLIPFFELEEITLLSLGLEPVDVFKELLATPLSPNPTVKPVYEFMMRRHELIVRTFGRGNFTSRSKPEELAAWVHAVKLDAHNGFLKMVGSLKGYQTINQVGKTNVSSAEDATERKPDSREIASMSKLLTAIAIQEYGYSPSDRRSPIPNEIESIADRLGLSVSSDTIRKYLQTGAKYLPKDWKPD